MVLMCRICDRPYTAKRSHRLQWNTCGETCRRDDATRKIKELRDAGTPLIDVGEDQLKCNLCGKLLKTVGVHMTKTHGIASMKGMQRQQRQVFYGITQGQRLEVRELRDRKKAAHLAEYRGKYPLPQREQTLSQSSLLQKQNYKKAIAVRRTQRLPRIQKSCPMCGNDFTGILGARKSRQFCSKVCSQTANSHKRGNVAHASQE